MSTYHSDSTDIKSLIGEPYHADYIWQEHERELAALLAEDESSRAYNEWANQLEETERAAALEQYAFERKQERLSTVNVNGSQILIRRDCNHSDCASSQCKRAVRLGGIAI